MAERHRWLKLKLHTYLCRRCTTAKVNQQRGDGWVAIWLLPDGTTAEGGKTPPCEPGPKTASRLEFYATELAKEA